MGTPNQIDRIYRRAITELKHALTWNKEELKSRGIQPWVIEQARKDILNHKAVNNCLVDYRGLYDYMNALSEHQKEIINYDIYMYFKQDHPEMLRRAHTGGAYEHKRRNSPHSN